MLKERHSIWTTWQTPSMRFFNTWKIPINCAAHAPNLKIIEYSQHIAPGTHKLRTVWRIADLGTALARILDQSPVGSSSHWLNAVRRPISARDGTPRDADWSDGRTNPPREKDFLPSAAIDAIAGRLVANLTDFSRPARDCHLVLTFDI